MQVIFEDIDDVGDGVRDGKKESRYKKSTSRSSKLGNNSGTLSKGSQVSQNSRVEID
tara:strand:- start:233 stop:403 length:171 start_codon:yes stop_codon:yes gene_type:complete